MDKNEFCERVRVIQTRLYRVAVSVVSRPSDAEDAVQDALISAWSNIDKLRNDSFFETWLIRILINRCKEILRVRNTHPTSELTEDIAAEAPPDGELRAAINSLERKYRLPLVMHCALGMELKEVARALRIPYGATKWRVCKGKDLVRRIYAKEVDET